MAIDQWLVDLLACPACKGRVSHDGDWIVCGQCGKRYPIRDDIPIMLIGEAVEPDEASSGANNG